jgi:hypothetical protein
MLACDDNGHDDDDSDDDSDDDGDDSAALTDNRIQEQVNSDRSTQLIA